MTHPTEHISEGQSPPPLEGVVDNHGRRITYLRLAVTDRCNLRCRYCMPRDGIAFLPHKEILSFEEMTRLVGIFSEMGITKLRLTGGEPFVRKGLPEFIRQIKTLPHIQATHLTTNGVATAPHIPSLKDLGIAGINLSLDSLLPDRFQRITGQQALDAVLHTLDLALLHKIPLKINTVIQDGINTDEIIPIAQLAHKHPIQVRFIEQMPFNGNGASSGAIWTAERIVTTLQDAYPDMVRTKKSGSTAIIYRIPGFHGTVGIIGGYSRLFCADCGKIRITPQGMLKTCLYDNGVLDLKKLLRQGSTDATLRKAIGFCIANRAKNGHEAELTNGREQHLSMASIGG